MKQYSRADQLKELIARLERYAYNMPISKEHDELFELLTDATNTLIALQRSEF